MDGGMFYWGKRVGPKYGASGQELEVTNKSPEVVPQRWQENEEQGRD